VVDKETGSQESLQDLVWPERGKLLAHAGSGKAILISSFTGSNRSFLSGG
jgi:hypothetical protein